MMLLFADDFETGDLSAWDEVLLDGAPEVEIAVPEDGGVYEG
jgi:hypothetical protein